MIVPAVFTRLDDFLGAEEHRNVLDHALRSEARFEPSVVVSRSESRRRSVVLPGFASSPAAVIVHRKLRERLPQILAELHLPPFPILAIEAQMTAHNHGDHFDLHTDSAPDLWPPRELTYVYYFSQEGAAFTGGALRIHDGLVEGNRHVAADSFSELEPADNTLVAFHSRWFHEVRPVSCPSGRFEDSRFTVNGWVVREPDIAPRVGMARRAVRALRSAARRG